MQGKGSYIQCLKEFDDMELWLTIEMYGFYIYLFSIVYYLATYSLSSAFWP